MIRNTDVADLDAVARCYCRAFPQSLSTALGKPYVRKTMEWFLSSDQNFLFHVTDETGTIIGFCGGMANDGVRRRGSATEMIQYAFNEGVKRLAFRPWLVLHPEMANRYGLVFKNLKRKIAKIFRKDPVPRVYRPGRIHPYTGLVVIGVDPDHQGKGIARLLMDTFEEYTLRRGFKKMRLSVKADNAQAIRAYKKSGWHEEERVGNSLLMSKDLTANQ